LAVNIIKNGKESKDNSKIITEYGTTNKYISIYCKKEYKENVMTRERQKSQKTMHTNKKKSRKLKSRGIYSFQRLQHKRLTDYRVHKTKTVIVQIHARQGV
jgi:hypothetical protein